MKITLSWLLEYLSPVDGSMSKRSLLEEITLVLTKIGLEVEGAIDWSEILSPFKVVAVTECVKHPNADSLSLCRVVDGMSRELQIVCGAPNARRGIKAILAPVGSNVGNLLITEATIRGQKSCGMLCSARELGISSDHGGILELPDDAELGKSPAQCLGLDDVVLDLSITPNMARVLSIRGLAREIGVFSDYFTFRDKIFAPVSNNKGGAPVSFANVGNISAAGAYIANINNAVPTPLLLRNRLESVGIRCISAVVDIINYCAHEIGQPMHAYDADKLSGGELSIERDKSASSWKSLAGDSYTIDDSMLVVSDRDRVVAIAGIIGGENSHCESGTANIFIESANFAKADIAKSSMRLGISTQASYRFERGVDASLQRPALKMAASMILDICGGEMYEITSTSVPCAMAKELTLSVNRLNKMSGQIFNASYVVDLLNKFGITSEMASGGDTLLCCLPHHMNDIECQEELFGEILKVSGYEDTPRKHATRGTFASKNINNDELGGDVSYLKMLRSTMAFIGYDEVMTWSFTSKNKAFCDDILKIYNPLSEEMSVLRPGIVSNLLSAVSSNMNRSFDDSLSIFELGPVYKANSKGDPAHSHCKKKLAALRCGLVPARRNIFSEQRKVDFFDIKADFLSVFRNTLPRLAYDDSLLHFEARSTDAHYHPWQSSDVYCNINDESIFVGNIGSIHPELYGTYDVKPDINIVAMELDCDAMWTVYKKLSGGTTKSRTGSYSRFQYVVRDFAFLFDMDIKASDILKVVNGLDIDIIRDVYIFDIYRGPKIVAGKQSIAISVIMQSQKSTLTDSEIDGVSSSIVSKISQLLNGMLREF